MGQLHLPINNILDTVIHMKNSRTDLFFAEIEGIFKHSSTIITASTVTRLIRRGFPILISLASIRIYIAVLCWLT
jgi:hypothetical protein